VNAVQQGNVRFNRTLPAAKSAPGIKAAAATGVEKSTGRAARAEYREADETILLTGEPRLTDTSPEKAVVDVAAERITIYRASGDALAEGTVKSSYVSQPGAATTHVVGGRALLAHAQQTVTFTGAPRLWQDGNSVEAPTLVLTDKPRGLLAESGADGPPAVHAVFVQHDAKNPQPPVRVTSRALTYSDAERKARFTNGVTLVDTDGTVRADKMDVFLKSAAPTSSAENRAATASAPMSGQVDHILAAGDVFLDQPLRQGTGEELVYTADDGKFVLTGSAKRPPRIEDRLKGTVTGDALVFLSRDSKVDVENGPGRTVTTTHLSNKGDSK
jgi:lipopolysaccharide export system protein LptA